jgi:hypothetical protein
VLGAPTPADTLADGRGGGRGAGYRAGDAGADAVGRPGVCVPVPDYVGVLVGSNSLDSRTGAGGRLDRSAKEGKPKRRARRQLATLRFKPRPAVTERVYQRVLDEVGPSVDPAGLRQQLNAAFGRPFLASVWAAGPV